MSEREEALCYDEGKPPLQLIVPAFKRALAQALAYGKKKYDEWQWTKGKAWSRDLGAVHRHLDSWAEGVDIDPESGVHNLALATARIMFLYTYQHYKLGTDDRKKFALDAILRALGEGKGTLVEHPAHAMIREQAEREIKDARVEAFEKSFGVDPVTK